MMRRLVRKMLFRVELYVNLPLILDLKEKIEKEYCFHWKAKCPRCHWEHEADIPEVWKYCPLCKAKLIITDKILYSE